VSVVPWLIITRGNQSLRFAPFLTELRVSSLLLWLIYESVTSSTNNERRERTTTAFWLTSRLRITTDSESDLLYDWRFTANQFVFTSLLGFTTSNFILELNICGYSPYVTSFLTRGWVRRLKLLLLLASAAILMSESSRTDDHILLSQIRGSPNLEGQVPIFISPHNEVAQLYA
jgi:hypothetical protein